jgi:hypothetical protein
VKIFLFCLLCPTYGFAQNTLPAIGQWREHLPYGSTIDVTASQKKIYAATPFSLFSVDIVTKETERISKIAGLSETGISTIKFDSTGNRLFVAYTNSNIDVVEAKGITNIPDLKRENIPGDKTIYHFFPAGNLCYLSTGIGVVVLDANRYEVKDSWIIGTNGSSVKITMFTKDNDFFYAATEEGLKKISTGNNNSADFRNWQVVTSANGLSAAVCKGVVNLQNKIIALQNDSLFVQNGNQWNLYFTNGWPIISINSSENKLTICQRTSSGSSRVIVLNSDGSMYKTTAQPGVISFPKNAIVKNGDLWVADLFGGLSHFTGNAFEQYKLNSPQNIATGEMLAYKNILYAAAGSVNDAWNYQYNRNGIYKFEQSNWTNYNGFNNAPLDSLLDFVTLAINPKDESLWAGSFGGGLLHIIPANSFEIYKQNSPISPATGDPKSYRVSGLAFDQNNNLWVSNYGASQYLHVLKADNTWKSFTAPFFLFENAIAQIIVDDFDQKWIVAPKGNGLIVFNRGASIDNTNDDKWRLFKVGAGNGNLPSSDVLSVAKDKNGFIWIGTTDGIGVIQCPQEIFSTAIKCEAVLPVVKGGNFNNFLFKGEGVTSIVVDGANRKWMATQNGVWLVSADGDKIIEHFTEENSSLLSNDVKRIAINHQNGEVFFATSKGICSFRGAATDGSETSKNLIVHPNPVPPGYAGSIAIKGLAANSFIKITELNGRLVFQTKAQGGQAIWNGKDYTGKSIASGVYLVLVIDEQKQEKAAGKIVFISQ